MMGVGGKGEYMSISQEGGHRLSSFKIEMTKRRVREGRVDDLS